MGLTEQRSAAMETAEVKPYLAREEERLKVIEQESAGFRVLSQANAERAAEIGREADQRAKSLVEQRQRFVKPLKDHVNLIEAEFRGPIKRYEGIAGIMRTAISGWLNLQEQKRLEDESRERNRVLRTNLKAIQEYAVKAETAKGAMMPPGPVLEMLERPSEDLIPSDADPKERGVMFEWIRRAGAQWKHALEQEAKGKKVKETVVNSAVEAEPVFAPQAAEAGGAKGRALVSVKIANPSILPPAYLLPSMSPMVEFTLTRGARIAVFELNAAAVLRDFEAGQTIPGLVIERKIGAVGFGK